MSAEIPELTVMVLDPSDQNANDMLRNLMSETSYRWVWRKLNNARLHIIFNHSRTVEYDGAARIVTNGDVWIDGGA